LISLTVIMARDKNLPLKPLEFVIILFLTTIISISLINSSGYFSEGIFEEGIRSQFNILIKGVSLFFIIVIFYKSKARLLNLFLVLLFVGTFLAVCSQLSTSNPFLNLFFKKAVMEEGLGVRDDVVFEYAPEGFRFRRTTFFSMDNNYLATLMAMTILLSYFAFHYFKEMSNRSRWLIFLMTCVPALVTLSSSGSRGGYIQLLAGFALLYILINRPSPLKFAASVFGILILGYVFLEMGDNFLPSRIARARILDLFSPLQESHSNILSAYMDQKNTIGKRLLNAQYALEYFFSEDFSLLVGGGSRYIPYANHIGYTIWFTRYGLLGLTGYVALGFIFTRYLLSDIARLRARVSGNNDICLVSLSLGLLTVIAVQLLSSPPPLSLWVIFGISSAIHRIISQANRRSSAGN